MGRRRLRLLAGDSTGRRPHTRPGSAAALPLSPRTCSCFPHLKGARSRSGADPLPLLLTSVPHSDPMGTHYHPPRLLPPAF